MKSLTGYVTNVERKMFKERDTKGINKFLAEEGRLGRSYQYLDIQGDKVMVCASAKEGKLVAENITPMFEPKTSTVYLENVVEGLYALVLSKGNVVFECCCAESSANWYQLQGYIERAVESGIKKIHTASTIIRSSSIDQQYFIDSPHNKLPQEIVFKLPASVEVEVVKESLIENLELLSKHKTLTISSVKPMLNNKNKGSSMSWMSAGVFALIFGSWFLFSGEKEEPKKAIVKPVIVDHYAQLRSVLEKDGVNIKIRMVELYSDLQKVVTAPGYDLDRVFVDPTRVRFDYKSTNDSRVKYLQDWSAAAGYILLTFDENTSVGRHVAPQPILKEAVMVPIQGVLNYINDATSNMMSNVEINSGTNEGMGKWGKRSIQLKVTDWSPVEFDVLGSLLQGQPISFDKATLTHLNNKFSGEIHMTIYGGEEI